MASMTSAMVATPLASRSAVSRPQMRRSTVCTAARPEAPRNAAKVAIASVVAAAILAVQLPAPAQADVKGVVCASNPTSKICLKDSGKK